MKNVYHVDRGLNIFSDRRVNPTYSTGQVILPVLFGFLLRNLPLNILTNQHRTQIMIVTTCMDMALKTLFKIIRARWDIENSIFNNLKSECGLEHCHK